MLKRQLQVLLCYKIFAQTWRITTRLWKLSFIRGKLHGLLYSVLSRLTLYWIDTINSEEGAASILDIYQTTWRHNF